MASIVIPVPRNIPLRKVTLVFTAASQLFFQVLCATPVLAGPSGGTVVGGQGSINQQGLNTIINQASSRLAIDWQSFNVAENESVQFIQPGRDAVALNRIFDQNPSQILGRIDANGSIVLVNPRGVLFGQNATVNVGGLVASALDIKTNDFMNGSFLFSAVEGSDGVVVNRGLLNAATGGSITLLGKTVSNEGLISARLGKVNLAAGSEAVLTFDPAGYIGVEVTKEVLENQLGIDSTVLNEGAINAEGGQVLMTAKVSKDLFSNAVNNKGIVQAGSIEKRNGAIFLSGTGSAVVNSGSLDVSATDVGVNGGDISVSGDNVTHSGIMNADAAQGDGGTIAIDSLETTMLTENSVTSSRSLAGGTGGAVTVLGKHVGLFDQSLIDASGANGGGVVLFGGDEQGLNPAIKNAEAIYIGENSTINVNATENGDGGKLIAYADLSAKAYGALTARGGNQSGDGGFIETSGKQFIDIGLAPDAGASNGNGGLWLIDPFNLTISANANTPDIAGNPFIAGQSGSNLNVTTLIGALDSNSVEVRTSPVVGTGPGTEAGDITVNASITYTGPLDRTLSLIADRHININQNINSTASALNLNLIAGDSTSGTTTLATGVSIQSNGGSVDFSGGVNILAGASITASGGINVTGTNTTTTLFQVGDATGGASIDTAGANFTFDETDNIQFLNGSTIDTDGGDITITNGTAVTVGDTTAGVTIDTNGGAVNANVSGTVNLAGNTAAATTITTAGGAVDITAASFGNDIASNTINTSGAQNVNGGNVSITTDDALSVGAIIAQGGVASEQAGLQGGAITLTSQNGGNISVAGTLDVRGSDGSRRNSGTFSQRSRRGGDGGSINLVSTGEISVAAVELSGGNADGANFQNSRRGGHAGSIVFGDPTALPTPIVPSKIVLSGDITAVGGNPFGSGNQGNGSSVNFTAPVIELGNPNNAQNLIAIDTRGNTNGSITFSGTLDTQAVVPAPVNLSLDSGTADITFLGSVGANISQQRLGNVNLNTDGDVLFGSGLTLEANSLTATTINRFTTVNAGDTGVAVNVSGLADTAGGVVNIGDGNTAEIKLGDINASGGADAAAAGGQDAGSITLQADNITVGALTAVGGDSTAVNGDGGAGGSITLTAQSQLAAVNGAIDNSGGAATGTGTGGDAAGINITVPNTNSITLANAITSQGGSAVSGSGGAGGTIQLTANNLGGGNTFGVTGAIDSSGGSVSDTGSGGTAGTVTLTTNQNLSTGSITAEGGDVTVSGNGGAGNTVNLNAGNNDLIALSGTISTAGGSVAGVANGNGANILIQDDADVAAGVSLSTGETGGNINFQQTIAGNAGTGGITLAAGTGDVFFGGTVGASGNTIGAITIDSANDVTANNSIFATTIVQTDGTGKTDLQAINASGGISLTGNEFDLRGVSTNGTAFIVEADGLIDFRAGSVSTNGGNVDLTSHGASLNLDRAISTAGGDVLITLDNANAANNALTISSAINTGTGDFEATQTGDLTIASGGSITTNGAASEVRIVNSDAVNINSQITTGGGAITVTDSGDTTVNAQVQTSGGAINITNTGAFDITNNGVLNTAGGNFTIQNSNSFDGRDGSITTAQGNVAINSSGTVQLGNIQTTSSNAETQGTLAVTSTGGAITQSTNNAENLVIQGNASFTANDGAATPTYFNVTLNNGNNQFGGVVNGEVNLNGENVILRSNSAVINLGASTVNGTLDVGQNNEIIQSGALTVSNTATFRAGGNAITLDDAGNDFQAGVELSNTGANNVRIDNSGNLLVGAAGWNLGSGNLTVNANGVEQNVNSGAIQQTAGASGAQFNAGTGPILLNDAFNNFTAVVTLNSSSAVASNIQDINDIELGASTLGGDLTVNAGDDLTVSGNIALAEQDEGFGNSALTLNFGLNGNGSQLDLQTASFVASSISVNGNADASVDTLLMNNGDYEWIIDGPDQGYIVDLGPTVRDVNAPNIPRGTPALAFNNVEKINSGSGDDRFNLINGGNISAGIDAGDGDDLIDLSGDNGLITIRIGEDVSNGVLNIEGAIGNGANSTLVANDEANTWTINGANSGQLDEDNSDLSFTFENFYNLQGGNDKDSFVFLNAGSIDGDINAGVNINTALNSLDLSQLAGNYDWNITNDNAGNIQVNGGGTLINNFSAVDVLLGSAGRDVFTMGPGVQLTRIDGNGSEDRIVGADRDTTWDITGENAGDVVDDAANGGPVKIYEFQEVESISGGTGVDTFDLSVAGAKLTNVDGGGGTGDVLMAGNTDNNWQIDADDNNQLINATANTQTTAFTAVENLVGGDGDDAYVLADQAVVAGTIDGGNGQNHLNMSAYTSAITVDLETGSASTVNGGLDAGVSNIAEFSAGTATDILMAQNVLNDWVIDGANSGDINNDTFLFSGFENLQGGDNTDNFVVTTSGTVSGTIEGDVGDDSLTLNYSNTDRTFTFDGGDGANDTVVLIGNTNGGSSTYNHDIGQQNEIVNTTLDATATNRQTLTIQNVAQVTDAMTADEIVVVGTLADDEIQLGGDGTDNQVGITDFTPVIFNNKTNVYIQGGGASDSVIGLAAPVSANRLTFDGVTTIGTDSVTVNTDVAELQIINAAGDVFLAELNGLDFLDSVVGGSFNVSTGSGDITASGALNITGNAVFSGSNGSDVILNNSANQFASPMSFTANNSGATLGQITLFNNLAVDFLEVNSSGLDVTTTGADITDTGSVVVQGLAQFDATSGDVILDNDANNFGILNVNNVDELQVVDVDNVGIESVSANTVTLSAGGAINDSNGEATNFIASSVDLSADEGIGHSDGLETTVSSLSVNNNDSGNINIANTGDLIVNGASNNGVNNGNISITASGNLTLDGDASSAGGVVFSAQNQLLQQADIDATNSVRLSAADIGQAGNINVSDTAANVTVTSDSGAITMADGFTTQTAGGDITYAADGNVTVSTLDAIYGQGDVRITSATGNILSSRDPVRTLPNVSANNATFVAPTGSLGTPARPLVINARNVFIQTLTSAPPVFTTRPDRIEDFSRVLLGVNEAKAEVGGNQRTEVDSLAIIDPAIFTQVKNYREDDYAIKLPEDQLFGDDEEDEDENKADPDIFESEKPYEAESAAVEDEVELKAEAESDAR